MRRVATLKELRQEANLTQERLAFQLGVSPLTIIRWERGETEPSASNVSRLALLFGVGERDVTEAVIRGKQKVS